MNTLLVVEDEKLIRQGIVAMIRRSSVPVEEILECRNGEEALEILRKQRVDVMFTDIRMPKMDGLTLVNKMEELSQKPVVIVLSGYDEFSYAVEMMKHGVRDYILKPIKRETIEQLLENLERELSETRETEEEEERCFLNQLRYLMMNAEMAEEKEMKVEPFIRKTIFSNDIKKLSNENEALREEIKDLKQEIRNIKNENEIDKEKWSKLVSQALEMLDKMKVSCPFHCVNSNVLHIR